MPVKVPPKYRGWVRSAAAGTGLPYSVVAAQIYTESRFQPGVTSSKGAEGIAQFLPGTYSEYGPEPGSPFNVGDAKTAYVAFMRDLLQQNNGDVRKALASYNAGPANWKAGVSYADHILGLAGQPDSLNVQRAGEGSAGSAEDGYRNPFRKVTNLTPERVDMGVDYGGTGPVYALGPGKITAVSNAWAGGVGDVGPGTWITEQLASGPLKGRQVYVAENISPNVRQGQQVTSKSIIGTMINPGSAGIETGFAAPGSAGQQGESLAASLHQQDPAGDPGGWSSAAGVAYNDVLTATGATPGITQSGGGHGQMPSWWTDIKDVFLGAGSAGQAGSSGANGGLGGIASAIGGVGDSLGEIGDAVEWLVNPTNEMRIMAGVGGGLMLLLGLYTMTKVGGQPVAFGVSIPFALPMSIILTGGGALLLFVAFHGIQGDSFWGAISQALHSGQLSAASAGGA